MNRKGKPVREWETVDEDGNIIASGYEDEDGNALDEVELECIEN
jgi:hypothetical protein